MEKTFISVQTKVNAPVETVWKIWTNPDDIIKWNNASDDWHTPKASNDLKTGGSFNFRMEAKDGSMGFDFDGIYDNVKSYEQIEYTMSDGRKVSVSFVSEGDKTIIVETFEAEDIHSIELQQTGWQAILDNFKKYTESKS